MKAFAYNEHWTFSHRDRLAHLGRRHYLRRNLSIKTNPALRFFSPFSFGPFDDKKISKGKEGHLRFGGLNYIRKCVKLLPIYAK